MKFQSFIVLAILLACLFSPATPAQTPDIVWKNGAGRFDFRASASIAFSLDGTILASAATNATTALFRAADGTLLRSLNGTGSPAFSPDGSSIALVGTNGVDIWRVSDGAWLQTLSSSSNAGPYLAYSPDGHTLVASFAPYPNGTVLELKRWHMPDGQPLASIPTDMPYGDCLAFSPDGRMLAAGDILGTAYVWEAASGQLLYAFAGDVPLGQYVLSVAFSPDSRLLAAGTFGSGNFPEAGAIPPVVKIWDMRNGSLSRAYTNRWYVPGLLDGGLGFNTVAFSSDGQLLLAGSQDHDLYFWRMRDGALLGIFDARDTVYSVAFSSDLRHYACGRGAAHLAVANNPLWIDRIARVGDQTVIGWQGGGGVYQLQLSTNAAAHVWQNVGDLTSSHAATNSSVSPSLYRVQSMTP